jgi:hypothetical protein
MKRNSIIGTAVALVALVGCGGGGGGGSSSAAGNLNVFVTDGANPTYDHVWVTIKKVELSGPAGTRTLFDDSTGRVVDLTTLRDNTGARFEFLARAQVAGGTFNAISATVDKDLVVFPSGSTTGQNRVFTGFDAASGNKVLSVSMAPTQFGSGNDDLVVDFDLPNWSENGSQIGGSIRRGDDNGLGDLSRHEHEDYHGTVAGLSGTAPNFTFTLTRGTQSFQVTTDGNTNIYNESGAANPTLANGTRVEVRGAFSTATHTLVASSVKIEDNDAFEDPHEVKGAPSNPNEAAGTFSLTIREADDFVPDVSVITVQTSANTVFFAHSGLSLTKAEFFAAMANATEVEVEGTYNPATDTFTAVKAKIEDGEGDEDPSEVEGPVSNVNAGALTFSITAQEIEGLNVAPGSVLNVQTTAATTFRDLNGTTISGGTFFAALANGARVEVEGSYDGSVFHAVKVHFEDN